MKFDRDNESNPKMSTFNGGLWSLPTRSLNTRVVFNACTLAWMSE
jgi:hypothetical protein